MINSHTQGTGVGLGPTLQKCYSGGGDDRQSSVTNSFVNKYIHCRTIEFAGSRAFIYDISLYFGSNQPTGTEAFDHKGALYNHV